MKNMNKFKQTGFTLVEIAIVLVIIGLLLGGILKGQELINSARVRNLADQTSGIQAAYYGFIDRYRKVPGDWPADDATDAIGVTIGLGGSGGTANNGRIDHGLLETTGAWEQLSKAGFIQGSYNPGGGQTSAPGIGDYPDYAPQNAFGSPLVLSRNDGYEDSDDPSVRLNLHLGQNIPVNVARELDVKVDDGRPLTGVLRVTAAETSDSGSTDFSSLFAADGNCLDGEQYNITDDAQNCGTAFLY